MSRVHATPDVRSALVCEIPSKLAKHMSNGEQEMKGGTHDKCVLMQDTAARQRGALQRCVGCLQG